MTKVTPVSTADKKPTKAKATKPTTKPTAKPIAKHIAKLAAKPTAKPAPEEREEVEVKKTSTESTPATAQEEQALAAAESGACPSSKLSAIFKAEKESKASRLAEPKKPSLSRAHAVTTLVPAKENKLVGEFFSMANFVAVQKHSVSFAPDTTKLGEEEKEEGLKPMDNNDKACR
jgi:hypothetical protein